MTLVLVPHRAERDRAFVWTGVAGTTTRPGDIRLTTERGESAIGPAAAWKVVDVDNNLAPEYRTTWTQIVALGGLRPGQRTRVRGAVDGQEAFCYPGTLPATLPRKPEPAYTILLGSCFASFNDKVGAAGANVAGLPEEYRPHVKLLCGDQVYLDNPWYEVLPRSRSGLAKRFLDKYLATWVPGGGQTGLSHLLAEGSTYFLADDHEFWNNHPNWGPLVASRLQGARDDWETVAKALYRSFQALPDQDPKKSQRFFVGPLEFYLIDTRFGRQAGDAEFMDPAELDGLLAWLQDGTTPGVLVLGAPIFTEPAGWFSSRFADRSLANYAQYARLADALLASRRPILALTGDVHFGRYATAKDDFANPTRLVEIAASPLALVDGAVGGKFHEAPARFPVAGPRNAPPGGVAHSAVRTVQWNDWRDTGAGLSANHFVTLGFHAIDRGVSIRATAWKIQNGPPSPAGWREFALQEVV
jgi:hypothetical protein